MSKVKRCPVCHGRAALFYQIEQDKYVYACNSIWCRVVNYDPGNERNSKRKARRAWNKYVKNFTRRLEKCYDQH